MSRRVPCEEVGRCFGLGKLRVRGSVWPWWTSRGRFQARASCGRVWLNSVSVGVGMADQVEWVVDLFAVEPLVFERPEGASADTVLAG